MARSYGDKESALRPVELSDEIYTSIGKLVRAAAEAEALVDCFISNLSGISEANAQLLMGRANIKRRIEIAETLCSLRDDLALDVFKSVFDHGFYDFLDLRNALAHGDYLGMNEEGYLCFLGAVEKNPNDGAIVSVVYSWKPESLHAWAAKMPAYLKELEKKFQVEETRSNRHQEGLIAHRKAQPQKHKRKT